MSADAPLIFALPSKGRLQEQTEAYLADCGLRIERDGRGYAASLPAAEGVEVRLISAGDIARALRDGEVHAGVTGEDVLREADPDLARSALVKPLGFGHADLVLAIPRAWVDVTNLADFAEVCAEHRARTGERLRVATKYLNLARRYLDAAGVADYRLVESPGATEGAPASGTADAIIDITTTGQTLAANHLTPAPGAMFLRSQAHLAASLTRPWSPRARAAMRALLDQIEARMRAKSVRLLRLTAGSAGPEAVVARAEALGCRLAGPPDGAMLELYSPRNQAAAACAALQDLLGGAVGVFAPEFVFEAPNAVWDAFAARLPD
jgi:ATP phosphoribosyltransferase